MSRTFIIAEAGVNHDGDLSQALRLVEAAASAGADAVKFQTFVASELASDRAEKAEYQVRSMLHAKNQLSMLSDLQLSTEEHTAIAQLCAEVGIEFLSTPFGLDSLSMLVDLGVRRVKIASGEITNGPLLLHAARTGLPLIVSTGMSTLDEVADALRVVSHGQSLDGDPARSLFETPLDPTPLTERVTVLHCTSEYPAPPEDVNLRAMDTLASAFSLPVGYSDHTTSLAVPVAAVSRGATIIEKHLTLDRSSIGPDHAASIEPDQMGTMVQMIRETEAAMGTAEKKPTPAEMETKPLVRRSVVAKRHIPRGAPISEAELTSMRPGVGLSPMRTWELVGCLASRDYSPGEAIDESQLGS